MSLLLRNGLVLVHDDNNHVTPVKADIFIIENKITKIEPNIDVGSFDGCEILDCSNKIISPGFIDTHRHSWQGVCRGVYGDAAFVPYMAMNITASKTLRAEDMMFANLLGGLEAIDAGTTTTLDHAHMNFGENHSENAIAGTLASGVRSVFAYTPTNGLTTAGMDAELSHNLMPDWIMPTFEKLAKSKPLTDPNSRVRMGLGIDYWFLPKEVLHTVFDKVKSLGTTVFTSHYIRPHGPHSQSLIGMAKEKGLLQKGMVWSHAGGATQDDVKDLTEADAYVSVTPSTEASMVVGPTVLFKEEHPELDRVCCLGIDTSGITGGSLVNEMRMALSLARAADSEKVHQRGSLPDEAYKSSEDVFNLATIQGAKALLMENEIGSIRVGKKADLVVFDMRTPSMIGVAQKDPVLAIVQHSSIRDIDHVIVDGRIRKKDGQLFDVETVRWSEEDRKFNETGRSMSWEDLKGKFMEINERFLGGLKNFDLPAIGKGMRKQYYWPGTLK